MSSSDLEAWVCKKPFHTL